jgi:hypothetical protein
MSDPALIEPGARYFFQETLKHCRSTKTARSSIVFNVMAFAGLCALIALFLCYKKRSKLTFEEVQEKELRKQIYLAEKLKMVEVAERRDDMITNLPKY